MKQFYWSLMVPALALAASCSAPKEKQTSVSWQIIENTDSNYLHRVVVKGDLDFDRLGFNAFARKMHAVNPQDTIIEIVPGYYMISSPRLAQGGDSVVIDIVTRGSFSSRAYAPDGFHRIESDLSTTPVAYTRMPITERKQWKRPSGRDVMPYGPEVYDINEQIFASQTPCAYAAVPSFKSVKMTQGSSATPLKSRISIAPQSHAEGYTIEVRDDSVIVTAADQRVAQQALYSFQSQIESGSAQLPNAVITDYPDLPYRSLMLDISRNYQTPETMKRMVDYMAQYRLNTLHFHAVDDEAWRIEIKPLPELTEVGGRRGFTTDEHNYLAQIFCGDGNPQNLQGTSNGYFTRDEFIDFIKYAHNRGVDVIPEIESPGHARAAIKAMEKRYRESGDASYRLIHDGDTSEYTSAQAFHDNVMNPALPGPYKFMETVVDELKAMYDEAGVPLVAIHIGGDEVAHGAWNGSSVAQEFMKEHGLEDQTQLHGYFVEQIAQMLQQKGIPMSGWQEIGVGHTDEYNAKMAPNVHSVNVWQTIGRNGNVPQLAVEAGYNTVLSNVNHFYMDMKYNDHPEEMGLNWGGTVDEFKALHGIPARLCQAGKKAKGKVIGISGQLFAETMRSPEMMESFLFPKMLGLAERAWNVDSTYSDTEFNSIIAMREIPRYEREGRNFHLRQPGIKMADDGSIHMNSPYPDAQIRYTLDGSEPSAESALYSGPFDKAETEQVRARLYFKGKESLTSILFLTED
ncbi:MAG: family 20 glycosylhydrolase [Bacteroidales bacterium]|nr:family 20 glycosylhydrolase [Bacteroidales bacterium]